MKAIPDLGLKGVQRELIKGYGRSLWERKPEVVWMGIRRNKEVRDHK